MPFELALTPQGHVVTIDVPSDQSFLPGVVDLDDDRQISKIIKGFAACQSEGLFLLATTRLGASVPSSWEFWRSFAGRYLTDLCHLPDAEHEPTPDPDPEELESFVLGAPPMPGAEYLCPEILLQIRRELDQWVREQAAEHPRGLAGFLSSRAPMWQRVGRVCFHLAERKGDAEYPFAFLATYASTVSASSARVQHQPLSHALKQYSRKQDKKTLIRLLSPVHAASKQSELVRELLESGDLYHPLAWTPAEAHRFLKQVPVFEACGIVVRLPDWWKRKPRPRVTVTVGSGRKSHLGTAALLDFEVAIAIGDERLSRAELEELMRAEGDLVWIRGQWVEVDRDKLQQVLRHWQEVQSQAEAGLSFAEGMRLLADAPRQLDGEDLADETREWSVVRPGGWLAEQLAALRTPDSLAADNLDRGLKTRLRPYQRTGVAWLKLVTGLGLGACLADDMGLGKTVQILALLLALKRQRRRPSLLVLPASLLGNWKAELERFAPSLRTLFVHPSESSPAALAEAAGDPARAMAEVDVVLTTYGMLLRQHWLLEQPWPLVVLDEAQAIKNPAARQTRAAKKLQAEARVALTGTPIENRLSDLWSLFDFICPGLLGSIRQFKTFVKRLETRQGSDRYAPLRKLVQPYILRRMKTDKRIIADLPEKTEVRAYCGLSKRQAALYAKLVQELEKALENVGGIRRRGIVLSYLTRFKQLCNHPSQLTEDGVFEPQDSGKFLRLAEICQEIASRQEKALIFTQFREMTEPLNAHLASVFGRPGIVLHGGTAVGRRKKLVDQFQTEHGPPYFILSLKAGGTGLNLTAASHVIHFDRWWNPAVENQATDRAFRIGQQRNILVHKFVCRGTIEEHIDQLIEEKIGLSRELLEGGAERMITEMSDRELLELVSLDIERVRL